MQVMERSECLKKMRLDLRICIVSGKYSNVLFRCQRIIQCKHTVFLCAVLSRSRLTGRQNKRIAFPKSAGFLPARLPLRISLSFSKTGAVKVSASLIAILELAILSFYALVPRLIRAVRHL